MEAAKRSPADAVGWAPSARYNFPASLLTAVDPEEEAMYTLMTMPAGSGGTRSRAGGWVCAARRGLALRRRREGGRREDDPGLGSLRLAALTGLPARQSAPPGPEEGNMVTNK